MRDLGVKQRIVAAFISIVDSLVSRLRRQYLTGDPLYTLVPVQFRYSKECMSGNPSTHYIAFTTYYSIICTCFYAKLTRRYIENAYYYITCTCYTECTHYYMK